MKQLPAIYSEHPPPPFVCVAEFHKTREPSAPPATVSGVAGDTGLCSASLPRSVHDQHHKGAPGTLHLQSFYFVDVVYGIKVC